MRHLQRITGNSASHLHDVSKALYPSDPDRARLWADVRCDELEDGSLHHVLAVLRSHASDCGQAAQCAAYIEHNRERMQYADFRARGLCVASGVVESGCKIAIESPAYCPPVSCDPVEQAGIVV